MLVYTAATVAITVRRQKARRRVGSIRILGILTRDLAIVVDRMITTGVVWRRQEQ
jgi:hypothetical protein